MHCSQYNLAMAILLEIIFQMSFQSALNISSTLKSNFKEIISFLEYEMLRGSDQVSVEGAVILIFIF
jgi:hypothetical protein